MLSLKDFCAEMATVTVAIRGSAVVVRALSAIEAARIADAIPRPTPPRKRNENAGSLAAPIEDKNDPAYLEALAEWNRTMSAAEVAVAVDAETSGGVRYAKGMPAGELRAYLEVAARELWERLSGDELMTLRLALVRLHAVGSGIAEAKKN